MPESITFNTAEAKIVVAFQDGSEREYTDAASYLAEFPSRTDDVVAMGWANA